MLIPPFEEDAVVVSIVHEYAQVSPLSQRATTVEIIGATAPDVVLKNVSSTVFETFTLV